MTTASATGDDGRPWFTDDNFWQAVAPVLFGPDAHRAAENEASELAEALGLPHGATILDVFCGPGRLARPLAELGYRVVGVDRTTRYLGAAQAIQVPPGASMPEFHRIEFGKSGSVAPDPPMGPLDGAIWAGLSTGYAGLEFDQAVLEWIRGRLTPGSPLLLEVSTVEDLQEPGFESIEWFEERVPNEDVTTAVWRLQHSFVQSDGGADWFEGSWQRFQSGVTDAFEFRYQIYSKDRWATILGEAGFEEVSFGNHLSDFGDPTSAGVQPRERAQSWIRAQTPA